MAINQVSHQDDNVATGSSYQYVDWSKPSKDGWMAVQNPHLRMFSQVMCHITKEQRDKRRRALLQHQNFDFLFYLGWSGSFTQSKHNIMKVVQS